MKLDARQVLAPAIAVLILGFVLQTTLAALRASGAWKAAVKAHVRPESPYAALDDILARRDPDPAAGPLRDPFQFGSAPAPIARGGARHPHPVALEPAPEPAAPQPTLTSIIWDADPRATVRWEGRDISIRQNAVFADFVVKSITPTEVVLDRGGQTLVLRLATKGDTP